MEVSVPFANNVNGEEVMALLLDRRGDQITITEEVAKAAGNVWQTLGQRRNPVSNSLVSIRYLGKTRLDQQ